MEGCTDGECMGMHRWRTVKKMGAARTKRAAPIPAKQILQCRDPDDSPDRPAGSIRSKHQLSRTKYRVSRSKHPASGAKHQLSRIKHRVVQGQLGRLSAIFTPASNWLYFVDVTHSSVTRQQHPTARPWRGAYYPRLRCACRLLGRCSSSTRSHAPTLRW